MLLDLIIILLLIGGFFFLLVGLVGILRLPDVFTRMHAMSKCDTLGAGMILVALAILVPDLTDKVRTLLIIFLIGTINPVVAHIIARVELFRKEKDTSHIQRDWIIDNYPETRQKELE